MRALAEGAQCRRNKKREVLPWPSAVELHKIITLEQVAELTTLSPDSIKRHHADKIRHLGPRRHGIRLGDALAIGTSTRRPETAASGARRQALECSTDCRNGTAGHLILRRSGGPAGDQRRAIDVVVRLIQLNTDEAGAVKVSAACASPRRFATIRRGACARDRSWVAARSRSADPQARRLHIRCQPRAREELELNPASGPGATSMETVAPRT